MKVSEGLEYIFLEASEHREWFAPTPRGNDLHSIMGDAAALIKTMREKLESLGHHY